MTVKSVHDHATVKSVHDHAGFSPALVNDALKVSAFAEKVRFGEDKETRNGLQVGKRSFCKREKEFFCDVAKENVSESKNLTEMRKSDVLRTRENGAELVVRQTCRHRNRRGKLWNEHPEPYTTPFQLMKMNPIQLA